MKQLLLVLLGGACVVLVTAAPAAEGPAEFAVPCNDDGLAHIPALPEGARRPYSVRKRSRTVHREGDADDNTPQLPPGRRRFDAVLPDEQGHDITSSTASTARSQRRLALDAVNEVASEQQESFAQRPRPRGARRSSRPYAVAPVTTPEQDKQDPKRDYVVDSWENVRKYPTHLAEQDEDAADDNLTNNDLSVTPVSDQIALEGVDNFTGVPATEGDPDLPPGYRSKFPKRTFASDAGGSGDVLRLKPRKHVNQYQPQHEEEQQAQPQHQDDGPQQQPQRRPRPRPQPQHRQPEEEHELASQPEDVVPQAPPTGPGASSRGRQRFRASQRVPTGGAEAGQHRQRPQQPRRQPDAGSESLGEGRADAPDQGATIQTHRPLRRRPQPTHPISGPQTDEQVATVYEGQGETEAHSQSAPRPGPRRRPRPRPTVTTPEPNVADQADDSVITQDNAIPIQEDVTSTPPSGAQQLQRRPLRRRLRPRPIPTAVEEAGVREEQDNSIHQRPQRRRPQAPGAQSRTVSEESFQALGAQRQGSEDSSRGHGRKLVSSTVAQNLQVEVEHDGTAAEKKVKEHEPTLVRSAIKKVPVGHAGDPSPALIQKIVKNTLRRLKPQIAEHEGDVGVDILVKIIQVEDR